MKTWLRTTAWMASVALMWTSVASAAPITVTFTAANFAPLVAGVPPIDDPVSGVITYDATSAASPIDALTSISLVIAGHAYTIAETGFVNDSGFAYIGGLIDGVFGSGNFEDDFLIQWDVATAVPLVFLYAAAGSEGLWVTSEFPSFAVLGVPEPATLALLALALAGMGVVRERRRPALVPERRRSVAMR